jgi:ferredoxin
MAIRKIIKIDDEKCDGCGLCMPNCPEGALQLIDGKARLISDLFCDGLGACIKHCPLDAITIEEREAEPYDEKKVMKNIIKAGKNTILAHLKHLKEHGETAYFTEAIQYLKDEKVDINLHELVRHDNHLADKGGCPGARMMDFTKEAPAENKPAQHAGVSRLKQWPIQITLVPPRAPYFQGSHLLIAADCVPFAYADFHKDLLQGKTLLVGCPKLDDTGAYREKLTAIFANNDIKSVTYAHMEVPCCSGMFPVIQEALEASGKHIPLSHIVISIKGKKMD